MENRVCSYCKIKDNRVWVNGELFFEGEKQEDLNSFLSRLYKHIELAYPKFHKMDHLSKLGLLASELVVRNIVNFLSVTKNQTALVFANSASSLDTDRNHWNTIADKKNYFPSPSVFVYTLPNIVLGEIAIKHKLTGENAFFVEEHFNSELLHSYTEILLAGKHTTSALCGWVNVDETKYEAFVYWVKKANFNEEKEGFNTIHNPSDIQHLYTS